MVEDIQLSLQRDQVSSIARTGHDIVACDMFRYQPGLTALQVY